MKMWVNWCLIYICIYFLIYLKNDKIFTVREQMRKRYTQICVLTYTFGYYNVVFWKIKDILKSEKTKILVCLCYCLICIHNYSLTL